jgi:hypothetical protein
MWLSYMHESRSCPRSWARDERTAVLRLPEWYLVQATVLQHRKRGVLTITHRVQGVGPRSQYPERWIRRRVTSRLLLEEEPIRLYNPVWCQWGAG